jgi:catechol 2,3-dioxygenase-like lactoylglutathione lyase family enzyme
MIERIDHFVLTVRSRDVTCKFYERVLQFERVEIQGQPTALKVGAQKISVHETGHEFGPKAKLPTPGSADFCVITNRPLAEVLSQVESCGIVIECGPVKRIGPQGTMMSIYFRDPDGNLIEVSEYDEKI